jgi:hypothetical protein
MKLFTASCVLGVLVWIGIAVWLVRLSLGLEHITRDQIPAMLVGGPVGGLAAWYYVRREFRKRAAG